MKTKILLFIIVVLISCNTSTFAQPGWEIQTSSLVEDIVSIYNFTNGIGYALGDNKIVFKTTNHGINWITYSQIGNLSNNLAHCITALSVDTLFAISAGSVYKSNNGGLNWTNVSYGGMYTELYSVSFGSKRRGIASGAYIVPQPYPLPPDVTSRVHYTSNGGSNWTPVNIASSEILYCCMMADSLTGYVTGKYYSFNSGSVSKTTNGGISFWSTGITDLHGKYAIFFINNNTGWIGGNNGYIAKTTSGGNTWITQNLHSDMKNNSIFFINSMTGWAVCDMGVIRKTTNGGVNWNYQSCPVADNLKTIYFIDSFHGWIGTANGKILYTSNSGGPTGIKKISNNTLENYILFQNFPNPFNSTTSIKWQMLNTGNAKINVFDLLGKEIATLVNEELQPGTYEVTFNSGNLPSGIYFYRLTAGDFSETRKLVLIK